MSLRNVSAASRPDLADLYISLPERGQRLAVLVIMPVKGAIIGAQGGAAVVGELLGNSFLFIPVKAVVGALCGAAGFGVGSVVGLAVSVSS